METNTEQLVKDGDQLLTLAEAVRFLNTTEASLRTLVRDGKAPPYVKLNGWHLRFPMSGTSGIQGTASAVDRARAAQGKSMKTNGTAPDNIDPRALMRLPQVLALIPISRTAWWDGVREGKYPKPIKLGPRTTCWRAKDIFALLENLGSR